MRGYPIYRVLTHIAQITNLEFIYRAEAEVNTLRLVAVINIILAVNEIIQFEE